MKQIYLLLMLCFIITLLLPNQSLADSKYKLFDPKTNTDTPALMITVDKGDNEYYIGLLSSSKMCVIEENTNINEKNLIGGNCYGTYQDNTKYSWREIIPNTYLYEKQYIINERREERMIFKPFYLY